MTNAADELKQVPFFNSLNQRHLKRLASKFKERRFFIITEGEASVIVDGNEVAKLGPGDHFGELALIADARVRRR